MKRLSMLVSLTAALLLSTVISWAQSGYDLYQKALVKERAVGNVEEAIRLYQRVVKEFGQDHALAAKAQLRLGLLYERLGRKADAQRAFQAVLSQYAEQADAVRQARTGVARTGVPAKAVANAKPSTLAVRQVWAGADVGPLDSVSPDGTAFFFTDWETGDVAVREVATGKTRRLTNKGSWLQSTEFGWMPVASPDGKQVAYYWLNKNNVPDLRVVNLDGSQARVVYHREEFNWLQPFKWTPDGKQVLTICTRKNRETLLQLISVADGSARLLKSFGTYYPQNVSLSPDGRYVAYDALPRAGATSRDIYLLAVDTGRETLLVSHPENDAPADWTPDGKRLLFVSDRTGTMGMWMIQVADGKAHGAPELVKPDIGWIFSMRCVNERACFYLLRAGNQDVYSATLDWATGAPTAAPTLISQRFTGANSFADWSPDGKTLAYVTARGTMSGNAGWQLLSIQTVETGQTRELALKMNSFLRPRWSPDGRSLLVIGQDLSGIQGMYQVNVQTGEVLPVVQGGGDLQIIHPEWSTDGKAVIFQRNNYAEKSARLLVRDLATGQERELYRVNNFSNSLYPAPSPDGGQLAFVVHELATKTSTIKLVPVSGGPARDLYVHVHPPKDLLYFSGITWTPDGRELLLLKNSSKSSEPKTEIWRLPIAGGQPQPFALTAEWLRELRIHPDGKRVSFTAGAQKFEWWAVENFLPAPTGRRTSVSRR
jgi:Tol biopolymer transport system component